MISLLENYLNSKLGKADIGVYKSGLGIASLGKGRTEEKRKFTDVNRSIKRAKFRLLRCQDERCKEKYINKLKSLKYKQRMIRTKGIQHNSNKQRRKRTSSEFSLS